MKRALGLVAPWVAGVLLLGGLAYFNRYEVLSAERDGHVSRVWTWDRWERKACLREEIDGHTVRGTYYRANSLSRCFEPIRP